MLRAIAIAVVLTASVPGVARGAPWVWPLHGRVVRAFVVSPRNPYAAGQHRGIVIAAAPGAEVRSACTGRVAFAGSVGLAGPTVSVRCGRLRATYQGVSAVQVHQGDVVIRGAPVAALAPSGELRLGAREEGAGGAMNRYEDPAMLLGDDPAARPPLGKAPREGRDPRPERPPPVPPLPIRVPARVILRPVRAPSPAPLVAWLALGLLAAAVPGGAVYVRRARSRRGRTMPVQEVPS